MNKHVGPIVVVLWLLSDRAWEMTAWEMGCTTYPSFTVLTHIIVDTVGALNKYESRA